MIHKYYFNMSSNLKRTKFYFLIIAIIGFVIILVSSTFNVTGNLSRISSEIPNGLSKLKLNTFKLEKFLSGYTRGNTTDKASKNSDMINKTEKVTSAENDKINMNSTAFGHVKTETMIVKDGIGTTIDTQLQKNSNISSVDGRNVKLNLNNGTANDTDKSIETDRKVNVKEKVSETPNGTVNSFDAIHDKHKMISKHFIQDVVSNETTGNFEKFKNSKEEAQQVLDEIHKLKDELTGDYKHPGSLQRTKTYYTKDKKHVRSNDVTERLSTERDDRLTTERDINIFKKLKSRLKNLGFMNAARENYGSSNYGSVGWDVTSRPDVCGGCFEKSFRKIINEPNLCKGDVELLFLVASTFSNKDSRNAIRNTWCGDCNKPYSKMKLVFVFGNKNDTTENKNLLEESKEFHDIIQMDFHDTYANLTYKTMSSLQWSQDFCRKAKYVMKTDDDMYINTELLPLMLEAAPNEKFIGGMCWGPSSPHRDLNSKWYVSFVQYRHSLFPSMCSGTGYIMTRDVVSGVLRQSPNVPFFYLEDVYVAICVKKLGIRPVLLEGFKNVRAEFDPCVYRNQIITAHELNAGALDYVWTESRTCPKADLTPDMVYRPFPV